MLHDTAGVVTRTGVGADVDGREKTCCEAGWCKRARAVGVWAGGIHFEGDSAAGGRGVRYIICRLAVRSKIFIWNRLVTFH
jgi:hypothetical protein